MKTINLNGAVVETYPLTAAQRIHFYTVTASNLEYGETDFSTLRECILEGYRAFESMRLRFTTDEEGNLVQYLVPTEDREIHLCDFSHWQEEDAHNEM